MTIPLSDTALTRPQRVRSFTAHDLTGGSSQRLHGVNSGLRVREFRRERSDSGLIRGELEFLPVVPVPLLGFCQHFAKRGLGTFLNRSLIITVQYVVAVNVVEFVVVSVRRVVAKDAPHA